MLCSKCNKQPAILFFQKNNDKEELKGLCYDCAKEQGIDPIETLAHQSDLLSKDTVNLENMKKQFENIFKDFTENINLEDLSKIDGAITLGTEA